MDNRKVAISVGSIVMLAIFAFLVTCTVLFWQNKDKQDEAFQNGYDKGTAELDSTKTKLEEYRAKLTEANAEIVELNADISDLTSSGAELQKQITNLTTQKTELETQVNNLTTIKTSHETTISSLKNQVSELQEQVASLTSSGEDKTELIEQKTAQISELQMTISQLQYTNTLNTETISALKNQISSLSAQITELTLASQNTFKTISSLQAQISKLETSVSYYESFIANLEQNNQVVVTFEFDGALYNIQVIQSGGTVSVAKPTDTDYVIFNYWQDEDGMQVDLSSKTFTESETITANVTYRYDVNFVVDSNNNYNTQIVTSGSYATAPTVPTKTGYVFAGWSLNGVDVVELNQTAITEATTFVALWTAVSYDVTYYYDPAIWLVIDEQSVGIYDYSVAPDVSSYSFSDNREFLGWTVDGVNIVDVSSYPIVTDTVFCAVFRLSYDDAIISSPSSLLVPGEFAEINLDGFDLYSYSLLDSSNFDLDITFESGSVSYNHSLTSSSVGLTLRDVDFDEVDCFMDESGMLYVNVHNGLWHTSIYSFDFSAEYFYFYADYDKYLPS